MMVEVFRTNVNDPDEAGALLGRIHATFAHYSANFDLDDCDKILRVEACQGKVESSVLIKMLREFGFDAEVLSDDVPEVHLS